LGSYPATIPVTGPEAVCIGSTIDLFTVASGGTWSISDPTTAALENIEDHSVKVRGVKEGRVFVTYTTGTAACQTKVTFRVKVIPATPPTIIIGMERE
jgi:uncharacterized protein YjdB